MKMLMALPAYRFNQASHIMCRLLETPRCMHCGVVPERWG